MNLEQTSFLFALALSPHIAHEEAIFKVRVLDALGTLLCKMLDRLLRSISATLDQVADDEEAGSIEAIVAMDSNDPI